MLSDAPSSSWHPAMMPNSIADLPRTPHKDLPATLPDEDYALDGAESSAGSNVTEDVHNKSVGPDAWFPDYGTGDNWMEDANHDAPAHTPAVDSVSAPADETADETADQAPKVSSTGSKHFSTMSFTRTVSHEVNWNDDDDPEWNLPRTGADPFKFMPPNNRSNSFPAASPLEHHDEHNFDEPLSHSQAEDVAREVERDHEHETNGFFDHSPVELESGFGGEHQDGGNSFHHSMGGDLTGTAEEASQARFEEGIPFISSPESALNHDTNEGEKDLFGDENALDDDDFFNTVRDGDSSESQEPTYAAPPTLERKTTTQVLDSLDIGSTKVNQDVNASEEATHQNITNETPVTGEATGDDHSPKSEEAEDLAEKWKALLGDEEDELLLDESTETKELDPAAFFDSDDDGFLEDTEEQLTAGPSTPPAPTQVASTVDTPAPNGRYFPPNQTSSPNAGPGNSYFPATQTPRLPPAPVNQYHPATSNSLMPSAAISPFPAPSSVTPSSRYRYAAPPPPQETNKPQSFVTAKGGYTSPYDLPMDVALPKKRASMQNLQRPAPSTLVGSPLAPPRSASLQQSYQPPPTQAPSMQHPSPGHAGQTQPAPNKPAPPSAKSKDHFFEDLPIATKPRPASRHSNTSLPSPSPYASLPSNAGLAPSVPAVTANRYSPAPPAAPIVNGSQPTPGSSRYSPAPAGARQTSGGPLAHFEITHERSRSHAPNNHVEGSLAERRSSSSMYDPRLQRVPSLPPTREVEEDEGASQAQSGPAYAIPPQPMSPPESRVPHPPQFLTQTPPPSSITRQPTLSPPKRATSNYSPIAGSQDFAPPPRSQTQSPGALYGNRIGKPVDPIPRPSSVHDSAFPRTTTYPSAGAPLISWGVGGTVVTMFPKDVPRYGMNQSVPMVVRSPGDVKLQNVKDIQPMEERLSKFPGPLKGKSKKKETIAWLTTGIESLERSLPNNLHFQPHVSHDDKRAMERVLLWKILRLFIEHDGLLEGNPTIEKAVRDILSPDLEAPVVPPVYDAGAGIHGPRDRSASTMQSDAVDSSTVEQIRRHLLSGDREKAIWTAVDMRLWGHALLLSNALEPNLYKKVAQEFVKKEVNFPGHNNESLATLYEVLSGNHEESVDELVPVHARAGLQLVAKDAASGSSKDAVEGLDKWRETLSLILSNRSNDDARAINSLGSLLSGYGRAEAAHICFMFARHHTVFGGLDDPSSDFVLVGSDHRRQAEQFAKEIEPLLLSEVYEYGQSLAGGSNVAVTNPHLAAYKLQHAFALAEYGMRDKALQYCEAIAAAITSQTRRSPYHHPILEAAVEDLMTRLRQAPKEESGSWIPKPSMNKVSDTVWNRFSKFVAGDENDSSGQGSPKDSGESGPFAHIAGGTPTISRSPSANNLDIFGAPVPGYGMSGPLSAPLTSPMANGPAMSSAPPTRAASRYAPGAAQAAAVTSNSYALSNTYAPRSSMERTSGELTRSSFELPRRSSELQPGYADVYSPNRVSSPSQNHTPFQANALGLSQEQQYNSNQPDKQNRPHPPNHMPATPVGCEPFGYTGGPPNEVASGHPLSPPASGSQTFEATNGNSTDSGYQAPSYGYEPPSFTPYEAPEEQRPSSDNKAEDNGSYEPPSYQPYSYEPPSYEPDSQPTNDDGDSSEESKPKPKKEGILYDDDDDFSTPKPSEKSKEEKDRENAELFRKAAEEDAKRAAEAKQGKKGWGFTGWFGGGGKKDLAEPSAAAPGNKPIRAKLGEANSFYYDPDQKRWVNKNAGPEDNAAKKATPPPPRTGPGSSTSSPGPSTGGSTFGPTSAPGGGRGSAPPTGPPRAAMTPPPSGLRPSASEANLMAPPLAPPTMMRSVSNTSAASTGPPSRPNTALSHSSSIDDLIGAAGPRKAGAKKPRKSARYVDVMTK
ncbi:COPII coat assembly protein SEC16 [Podospora didyma]|uniref:Protein transport protein sec16 n=1 Tax=Podospora didyma TaxID=330526 RepID=A0AAE0K4Z0_9PEZI|nr:COPII coat assembly protein SEC16 [Podospora didyma]